MKKTNWRLAGTDGEVHTLTVAFSRLKGKVFVTLDGEEYTLPAGFLGLSVARREMLLLGEDKALLVLDKAGRAALTVEGEQVEPETQTDP